VHQRHQPLHHAHRQGGKKQPTPSKNCSLPYTAKKVIAKRASSKMAEVRPLDEPQAEELIKDWELSWTGINFNHAKKAKKPPSSSWT